MAADLAPLARLRRVPVRMLCVWGRGRRGVGVRGCTGDGSSKQQKQKPGFGERGVELMDSRCVLRCPVTSFLSFPSRRKACHGSPPPVCVGVYARQRGKGQRGGGEERFQRREEGL